MLSPPGMMHRQTNGLHVQSPSSMRHMAPRSMPARPTLPERNVTGASIEETYVRFVFYCNPAVPSDTDTAALREAFRNPPKSGGKTFSTFALFQLIRQLETKEIKTWAELALKLGVEPPDQDKGQSSQKIQQYAVRLKRWMHSMHLDAFFEYLMDHPHPYWTQIPTNANPVSDTGRDGVAAEDDMALRALLPQIRPRRGRKRPDEDELSKSPSQRPRIDSPPMLDDYGAMRHDGLGPWSAHPDGRNSLGAPMSELLRSGSNTGSTTGWAQHHDAAQTPLTAFPQGPMSAITPSTRNTFWAESSEPRSAITPSSKRRAPHNRHGAKVVSSAWRSTGKTRGRPPINRTPIDCTFSAFPSDDSAYKSSHDLGVDTATADTPMTAIPHSAPPTAPPEFRSSSQAARPGKPSISLQVPQRAGGAVRLATPPPMVTVNGNPTFNGHEVGNKPSWPEAAGSQLNFNPIDREYRADAGGYDPTLAPKLNPTPAGFFDNMEDGTNWEALYAYLIQETIQADWFDAQGNPIGTCTMEDASIIVSSTLENMRTAAANEDAFLINVAALAGGKFLMATNKLKITRHEESGGMAKFVCKFEYRLGAIRGLYSIAQSIPLSRWKKAETSERADTETLDGDEDAAQKWQQKYQHLMDVVKKKDQELRELQRRIMTSLKESKQDT